MKIKNYSDWKSKTNIGVMSTRSPELKALDATLKTYFTQNNANNKEAARQALEEWQSSKTRKGKNWRTSDRNKNGAVVDLHNHLNDTVDAEAMALVQAELEREHANVILQFKDKQITWKNEFRGKLNSNLVKPHKSDFALYLPVKQYAAMGSDNKYGAAGNSVSAGLNTASLLKYLLSDFVPEDQQAMVLMEVSRLVPNFMSEFTASCAPFTGIATSAGITLWNVKNTIKSSRRVLNTKVNLHNSLAGKSGTAAIEALIEALERYRNADIYSMGVSASELGGKIVSLGVDGGMATNTAISLTANILKLLNIARIVYNDMQEKKAANMALRAGIDITIFETCPLVGCYWLNIAPNNVMLSGIYDQIGNVNWQDHAFDAHQALGPLRETARKVIDMHRFEIVGLSGNPGGMLMKPNLKELARMRADVGKSGMVGFGSNG